MMMMTTTTTSMVHSKKKVSPLLSLFRFLAVAWLLSSATLTSAQSSSEQTYPYESYFGGRDHDVYLEWVRNILSENYPSTAFLPSSSDPNRGAALHWRITGNDVNDEDAYLDLAVAVRASGWMGFGLTVNGGMTGADMVLVEAKNPGVAKDAYVADERVMPIVDDCQDWQIVNSTMDVESNFFMQMVNSTIHMESYPFFMVQLRRKLHTGDNRHDLVIRNDSLDAAIGSPVSRVIAAWGDEEEVSYHGPNNTARGAIRWFGGSGDKDENKLFQQLMTAQADNKFFLSAVNHSIPDNETTQYAYFCFNAADIENMGVPLLSEGVTLIGINPIVDNAKHLHHFILYASVVDLDNATACSGAGNAMNRDLMYAWAPGETPFALPNNVGFKLGGSGADGGGYKSFVLEIHYDNSDLLPNQMDSSGVEFYYSLEARDHEAAFLVLGDPTVALRGREIAPGLTDYNFYCPGTCSSLLLLEEPVTVLVESLHMHQSGYSAYVEHLREGQVIRKGSIEYFDFDQTGGPVVPQESFQVYPGDSFNVRCFYKNDNDETTTSSTSTSYRKFGLASSEEMCMAFLLYYPKKSLKIADDITIPWVCGVGFADLGFFQCDSAWTTQVLTNKEELNRTFGSTSSNDTTLSCRADDSLADNNQKDDTGTSSSSTTTSSSSSSSSLFYLRYQSILPVLSALLVGAFVQLGLP